MPTETHAPTHIRGLQQSYDSNAASYDEQRYHSATGKMFTECETSILRSWLQPGAHTKILDVPAGTGRFSLALAESGASVVALDISANMLSQAAAKRPDGRPLRLQFTQASGLKLPFPDNTFDALISFKFFHLIPNDLKRQFIEEMARVLKPGCPMIVEFNSPYYGGALAWLRYNFRKKHPGGMRMKCLFPDQIPVLFRGLDVSRRRGVQLPFAVALSNVFGRRAIDALSTWIGSTAAVRYLSYVIILEVRKPAAHA
jgi:ubiquinone/menaquinone biosynthesis C-methylase UbiE